MPRSPFIFLCFVLQVLSHNYKPLTLSSLTIIKASPIRNYLYLPIHNTASHYRYNPSYHHHQYNRTNYKYQYRSVNSTSLLRKLCRVTRLTFRVERVIMAKTKPIFYSRRKKSQDMKKVYFIDLRYCSHNISLKLIKNHSYFLFLIPSKTFEFPPSHPQRQALQRNNLHNTHSKNLVFAKLPIPVNSKSQSALSRFLKKYSKNPKLILSTKRRKLLLKQNENLTLGCRFHNDQNTKTKATSRFADNNYKNRHLKSNLRNGYSRMFHEKRRSINFLEKESSVNLYRNIRRKHLVMQWFKNGKPLIPTRTNKKKTALQIRDARQDHNGVYRCVASYMESKLYSPKLYLSVKSEDTSHHFDTCSRGGYCLNGGVCSEVPKLNMTLCSCQKGFEGKRCEEKVTEQKNLLVGDSA